nr:zinc ribbon domain-containing protein [Anaerolineaceae bacterium]
MSELLCSNCQTAIRHDARFCGVCGAKLNPITQSPSQAQQTQSNQRYPNLLSEYEEFVPRGIQKKAQTSVPIDQLESLYKDIKKGREPQFSAAIQFFNDYLPIGSGVRLLNLIRDVNDEVNKGKIYNILIQMNDFELIQKIVSNKDYLSSFDLYHSCLILEG